MRMRLRVKLQVKLHVKLIFRLIVKLQVKLQVKLIVKVQVKLIVKFGSSSCLLCLLRYKYMLRALHAARMACCAQWHVVDAKRPSSACDGSTKTAPRTISAQPSLAAAGAVARPLVLMTRSPHGPSADE